MNPHPKFPTCIIWSDHLSQSEIDAWNRKARENFMLTTNTPGYVTLRNLLTDLSAREDDEVQSYLQTLTSEDLYTLEQVANKEGMPMMAAVVHGHSLTRKLSPNPPRLAPGVLLRIAVAEVLVRWEDYPRRPDLFPEMESAMAELKAVHEGTSK